MSRLLLVVLAGLALVSCGGNGCGPGAHRELGSPVPILTPVWNGKTYVYVTSFTYPNARGVPDEVQP